MRARQDGAAESRGTASEVEDEAAGDGGSRRRPGRRARSVALFALTVALGAVGAAYLAAFLRTPLPAWATWLFAAGTVGSLVASMALGAAKEGGLGGLVLPFFLVLVVVGGGFSLLLLLSPVDPHDPVLILGLPPRAAVLLYGIGLLPTFVVPVAYALTFDRFTLTAADLERVRGAVMAEREGEEESDRRRPKPR